MEGKHTPELSQEDKESIADQMVLEYPENLNSLSIEGRGFMRGAKWGFLHERDRLQTELSEMKKEREELHSEKTRLLNSLTEMVNAVTVMPRPPHPMYVAIAKAKHILNRIKK